MAKLTGTVGNDTLSGLGADIMAGGKGHDVYYYNHLNDEIVENENEGTDTVYASVDFDGFKANTRYSIENITLTGTAISATGTDLDNIIRGNAQANKINGMRGNDTLVNPHFRVQSLSYSLAVEAA